MKKLVIPFKISIVIEVIMKWRIQIITSIALFLFLTETAIAQVGKPFIHDPSTITECEGKYFTFGTGGGGLISEDGWTWNSGGVRPGGGAAPDVVKIGDRYLVAYGATGGGLGGGHNGRILTMWNKTLDPKSADFKYSEAVVVVSSNGVEDNDAIDPGLLLDPTDGRLWLSYGTYFGFIRLVELDPKTGKRVEGNKAINIAIDCEATDLIYRDGWYYLLGTHGTCCDGANSTYNIVVGRSRKVTGPYLDNIGRDMIKGGGKMVLAASERLLGPGHFGRTVIGEGVEKMSCHYEADLDQSGRSVLGIRPLLWKNGWPVAGDHFKEGTYEIESERRGYALELVVDFVRMPGGMRFNRNNDEPIKPVASQELADVIQTWPTGNTDIRIGDYMGRPHQKWMITAVPGEGYLGGPYYKIVIEGTERALAATANAEVITVPKFTGAPEQLWRIDQLTDGTYRIMPKSVPDSGKKLALLSSGDSTPTLEAFDFNSDNSKWNFKAH
jgi:arabinan endo-1,5-alpha-L-arabinosidase